MKHLRIALIICLLAVVGVVSRSASAQTEGPAECTDTQIASCPGYGWSNLSNYGGFSGHHCTWHGLTLECTDTEWYVCNLSDNSQCLVQGQQPRDIAGSYQIADLVTQFVRLTQWGLGFIVVLAVLMFVWAGWQFITAGGRSKVIDEGKSIITGTITGLIISFAAYVIINFAVVSLTGASVPAKNIWAGPIGLVFPNLLEQQPFSGNTSNIEDRTGCRSTTNDLWNKACSDHIYCADTDSGNTGDIAVMQKKLNSKGCSCGSVDGCYGTLTTDCVRRFQVANDLPPSGTVDAATAATINQVDLNNPAGGPHRCDDPAYDAAAVMSNLPKAIFPANPNSYNSTDRGCCVVNDGTDNLYCLDQVTQLTCETLNGRGNNSLSIGKRCSDGENATVCGFCRTSKPIVSAPNTFNCFQYATPAWCSQYGRDQQDPEPLSFSPGSCSNGACGIGTTCRNTLLMHPR